MIGNKKNRHPKTQACLCKEGRQYLWTVPVRESPKPNHGQCFVTQTIMQAPSEVKPGSTGLEIHFALADAKCLTRGLGPGANSHADDHSAQPSLNLGQVGMKAN